LKAGEILLLDLFENQLRHMTKRADEKTRKARPPKRM
jgi:hypothetical protein